MPKHGVGPSSLSTRHGQRLAAVSARPAMLQGLADMHTTWDCSAALAFVAGERGETEDFQVYSKRQWGS
jgi:hypothetical protein